MLDTIISIAPSVLLASQQLSSTNAIHHNAFNEKQGGWYERTRGMYVWYYVRGSISACGVQLDTYAIPCSSLSTSSPLFLLRLLLYIICHQLHICTFLRATHT